MQPIAHAMQSDGKAGCNVCALYGLGEESVQAVA